MAKELKQIICSELGAQIGTIDGCVLVDYRGLNSEQTQDLRASLRRSGVRMTVVQNRLARRVFADHGLPQTFQSLLRGPTAILHGSDGAIGASKSLSQWKKRNNDLVPIKGGLFQGQAMTVAEVERLATIPDRDTLLGQTLSRFMAPAACLANATRSLLSHFAGCVKARREEVEEGMKDQGQG